MVEISLIKKPVINVRKLKTGKLIQHRPLQKSSRLLVSFKDENEINIQLSERI